ncbi:hypothetical protein EV424DRAFT_1543317 [Suillus variegatus]|nr:hypothetical protein EV424DRAFT_1543317 [Suillus variegatus]
MSVVVLPTPPSTLLTSVCKATFWKLKKIVVSIAKRAYDIFPQGSIMQKKKCQRQVTAAATRLLKSGDYSNTAVLKGVISGIRETSTDKVPELTAEQCRTHFVNLQKSIDTLLDIPEHHKELKDMLEQWARIGMGDFNEYADASVNDTEDINIIL